MGREGRRSLKGGSPLVGWIPGLPACFFQGRSLFSFRTLPSWAKPTLRQTPRMLTWRTM